MASSFPLKGILKSYGSGGGAKLARKVSNRALNWGECPSVPREVRPAGPLSALDIPDDDRWRKAELFRGMVRCMLEDGTSPLPGRRVGVLRTGGAVLESDWSWSEPDVSGLLDGLYPCVLEKLLELTGFEYSVSVPMSQRRREVEADLAERRVKGEGPSWELRRTVSDLLEVDPEMQELRCVAAREVKYLQELLGRGKFAL